MASFDITFVAKYWQTLLVGLGLTLQFTAICILSGTLLGLVLALMSRSPNAFVRTFVRMYVELIRGVPVLILLFWIFFCLPVVTGLEIGNFLSSTLALTLFMGAATCESFRAALKSIPHEQYDACTALGLTNKSRILDVVIPLMVMRAIPNLLSNTVALFKESSLASAVGTVELMYIGQNIANSTARPIEVLTVVGILYFIVGFLLTRLVSLAETRVLSRLAT
ncbi:amino acid ABC transporter permease [Rhizobium sp. CCGE 510]|uniref:amino acid ABC transporter permease n=1 Tax=Rhizobium sp. CCGE 510 TaxID=1132836 RepID=UPI00027B80C6|nr:amino acid ABC transporter permease [Rhizobium sp. CCGE 510]EJT06231.1 polar amino acid ABC transporter inner membrane subunit [Rhizobium sp. CCGE 510]